MDNVKKNKELVTILFNSFLSAPNPNRKIDSQIAKTIIGESKLPIVC